MPTTLPTLLKMPPTPPSRRRTLRKKLLLRPTPRPTDSRFLHTAELVVTMGRPPVRRRLFHVEPLHSRHQYQVVVSERMKPARAGLPRALALPDPSLSQTTPSENIMNTKLYVLL